MMEAHRLFGGHNNTFTLWALVLSSLRASVFYNEINYRWEQTLKGRKVTAMQYY